jgi:N-acetylglucosaminyl transferase component (Gpi1)
MGCDEAFVVAGVVPTEDRDIITTIANVRRLCEASGFRSLHKECGTVPCILGYWDPSDGSDSTTQQDSTATEDGEDVDGFDAAEAAQLCRVQRNALCSHPILLLRRSKDLASLSSTALITAGRQGALGIPGDRVPLHLAAVELRNQQGGNAAASSSSSSGSAANSSSVSSSSSTRALPRVVSCYYPDWFASASASIAQQKQQQGGVGGAVPTTTSSSTSSGLTPIRPSVIFRKGPTDRLWYVLAYRPPDPLRLELLSTGPCRVPGMQALGTTALEKMGGIGGAIISVSSPATTTGTTAAGVAGGATSSSAASTASGASGSSSGASSSSSGGANSAAGSTSSGSSSSSSSATMMIVPHSLPPNIPATPFEAVLHQMNAAAFVHRYVTGEITIPQSTINGGGRGGGLSSLSGKGFGGSGGASGPLSISAPGHRHHQPKEVGEEEADGRRDTDKGRPKTESDASTGSAPSPMLPSGTNKRRDRSDSATSAASASSATSSSSASDPAKRKILQFQQAQQKQAAAIAATGSQVITPQFKQSVINKMAEATLSQRVMRAMLYPVLFIPLVIRWMGELTLRVLLGRVPARVPIIGGWSLYDRSALTRQLHLKICEFCAWPSIVITLKRMKWEVASGRHWHSADSLYSQTAQWHDTLWRSLFDFFIGIAACLLLSRMPWLVAGVLRIIHTFGQILHIDVLRTWIDWLMGLPAGLKLNHFAGRKIGGAVLSFISFWEYITTFLTPWEPAIVVGVGLVGLGGGSLLLAVTSDVLELTTIHLYTLYAQFAWLHNRQMMLLGALWKLFRGKKKNVLRNRVDSNDFDMAQLLLGTLLFTVVFFLFPTTLVYYAFFLSVYMGIQFVRGAIWWLTTVLNNLPLYTLYCLVFSPRQLPAGIYVRLKGVEVGIGEVSRAKHISTLQRMRATMPGQLEFEDSDLEDEDSDDDDEEMEEERQEKQARAQQPIKKQSHHTTVWFSIHPDSANPGIVLAPLLEAFSVVTKKVSLGLLFKIMLFGEPGLSLLGSFDEFGTKGGPGASGDASSKQTVASTGLGFGIVNAAANAPVDFALPAAKSGGSTGTSTGGGSDGASNATGGGAGGDKAPAANPTPSSASGAVTAGGGGKKQEGRAYRLLADLPQRQATHGTWREFWHELNFLCDCVLFGMDHSPPTPGSVAI